MMQQSTNPPQSLLPVPGALRTRAEFDALNLKRGELVRQLESVTERRRELAEQIRQSDAATGRDLTSRLKTLDDRSARLEREILQADDAVADALARGVMSGPRREGTTIVPPRRPPDVSDAVLQALVFETLAFVLFGFVAWRFWLKRTLARMVRPAPDQAGRLDELQNAVDAIALEVERISEGQRFVTKIVNEKLQPALGEGEAQPIPGKRKDAAPISRSGEGA